ncbi:MAG TPA: radical SAM protein [Candidatus Aerophobetes bacterium]|uniref:Radical SAM protein n=1 Tax=Aerophobetes bacterium TaxID=2030807 RepID=A0A7V5HZY7_UNCAE|nr:radical SAM protein [Candidatus Aerophobetes bacterium]
MTYIFGPVPSRRLGFSLGVDVIPFKTCTLDCVYCQLGRTTNKTVERKEYISADKILKNIEKTLAAKKQQKIDYITFSGSGEPTLNLRLGYMIKKIKEFTSIRIAVLTNGTLLFSPSLQEELQMADLVIPSLDASDEDTFRKINRPHHSLTLEKVIRGIESFSRNFQGRIWLEVMIVKNINDSFEKMEKIAELVEKMNIEKIQLNTPVRPPAEEFALPVPLSFLKKAKAILGEKCEIIGEFEKTQEGLLKKDIQEAILSLIKRRPVTLKDISSSLGVHQNEVIKYIRILQEKNLIHFKFHNEKKYFLPSPEI